MSKIFAEEYRNIEGINYSSLSCYLKSPLEYKKKYIDKIIEPQVKTPAMIMGSLVDCLLTNPVNFDKEFKIADFSIPSGQLKDYIDYYAEGVALEIESDIIEMRAFTKVNSSKYKLDWFKSGFDKYPGYYQSLINKDFTYITPQEHFKAQRTVNCLLSDTDIAPILDGAEFQVPLVAKGFKGLLDVLNRPKKIVADLKCTDDGPKNFQSNIRRFNYHLQGALYPLLASLTGGFSEYSMFFIVINPNYPEYPMIWELSEQDRDFGMKEINRVLSEIEIRKETNNWYYPIEGKRVVTNIFREEM